MVRRLLLAGAGIAALLSTPALAQEKEPAAEALPPVVVEDEAQSTAAYGYGDPIDSGSSVFNTEAIETRSPGSGDVNQLLKALPSTHFSLTEGLATRENLQDIRPQELSISGGRTNENLFILDGVDASSRVDTTNDNAANYSELAGPSPQSFWVDSNLVGTLIVRDSNVSAEYGQFAGGVVEVITRAPSRAYGVTAYVNGTTTDLTSFKMSDGSRNALAGAKPDKPDYEKRRYGFSVDLPVHEKVRLLAGYSRSQAEVTYYRGANYANAPFGQSSLSENFLLKADADLPDGMLLSGQLTYTPFESEASNGNGINNTVVSHGGGWTGRLSLAGAAGDADWKLDATFSRSDTGRDGPRNQYNVSTVGTGVDWCTGSTCTYGFIGPLDQEETGYTLKGLWSQPLLGGDFRGGFDLNRVEAMRERPFTTNAYLSASVNANTVCADPNEGYACVTGVYALSRRLEYRAYKAEAEINKLTLWGEQRLDIAGFDVRLGARVEYEDFLGNWNLSPRLSASRPLPFAGMTLTVGANRYHGRSFLGYALRENSPGNYGYTRTYALSGTQRVWSNNWVLTSHSNTTQYSGADLKTPYSDELTAALSGPLFGGQYRIRGVLRENRDEFARSASTRVTYVTELGANSTYTEYTVTNDGESSYRGLNLEWGREFGPHSLSVSTSFSETKTSNITYLEESDDELYADDLVFYDGEVRSLTSVLAENQRTDYGSPLIVNADWGAVWWGGRIKTNVNARYRGAFEIIDDTGVNTVVSGVTYDVYGKVSYDPSVDFNLNASADIVRGKWGTVTLDARVDNLLDSIPYKQSVATSQPYQLGRTVWLGMKYRF